MSICSHIAFGCSHNTTVQLSSCNRNRMAQKAKNIYHLGLHARSLLTPGVDQMLGQQTD